MQRIYRGLVTGKSVHCGHETAINPDRLVKNVGHWCETIGGAGRVRDNGMIDREFFVIDAIDYGQIRAAGRSRNENPLGPGFQMHSSLVATRENTGAATCPP